MSLRERLLAAALLAAAGLIVAGVARLSTSAGLITAGVAIAVWAWMVLADDGSKS